MRTVLLGAASLLCTLVLAAGFLWLWGRGLPEQRVGTAQAELPATPQDIASVIRDVDSQPAWRPGVVQIQRDGGPGWVEVRRDGERIRFTWMPGDGNVLRLRFESSRGYRGDWEGRLQPGAASTTVSVRETSVIDSPWGRALARLFFDPDRFAAAYLMQLKAEVQRRAARAGVRCCANDRLPTA